MKVYTCAECGADYSFEGGFKKGRPPVTCSPACKSERLAWKGRESALRDYYRNREARQATARAKALRLIETEEGREVKKARDRATYRKHAEERRAKARAYAVQKQQDRDPQFLAMRHANVLRRRARRAAVETTKVTAADIRRMFDRQRGECFYCHQKAKLTVDHVIPIARGGRHSIGNLVGACMPCNAAKQSRLAAEFRLAVSA